MKIYNQVFRYFFSTCNILLLAYMPLHSTALKQTVVLSTLYAAHSLTQHAPCSDSAITYAQHHNLVSFQHHGQWYVHLTEYIDQNNRCHRYLPLFFQQGWSIARLHQLPPSQRHHRIHILPTHSTRTPYICYIGTNLQGGGNGPSRDSGGSDQDNTSEHSPSPPSRNHNTHTFSTDIKEMNDRIFGNRGQSDNDQDRGINFTSFIQESLKENLCTQTTFHRSPSPKDSPLPSPSPPPSYTLKTYTTYVAPKKQSSSSSFNTSFAYRPPQNTLSTYLADKADSQYGWLGYSSTIKTQPSTKRTTNSAHKASAYSEETKPTKKPPYAWSTSPLFKDQPKKSTPKRKNFGAQKQPVQLRASHIKQDKKKAKGNVKKEAVTIKEPSPQAPPTAAEEGIEKLIALEKQRDKLKIDIKHVGGLKASDPRYIVEHGDEIAQERKKLQEQEQELYQDIQALRKKYRPGNTPPASEQLSDFTQGAVQGAWQGVKDTPQDLWQGVKNVKQGVVKIATQPITTAKECTTGVYNTLIYPYTEQGQQEIQQRQKEAEEAYYSQDAHTRAKKLAQETGQVVGTLGIEVAKSYVGGKIASKGLGKLSSKASKVVRSEKTAAKVSQVAQKEEKVRKAVQKERKAVKATQKLPKKGGTKKAPSQKPAKASDISKKVGKKELPKKKSPKKKASSYKKKIQNLDDIKHEKASKALRDRGGNASAMRQGRTDYWEKTIEELAKLAVQGDKEAGKILKLVKKAGQYAQKYGGK